MNTTATVKITPSDDKGRSQFNKRHQMLGMMKQQPPVGATASSVAASAASGAHAAAAGAELSASSLERGGADMLCAPTEDVVKSRW